MNISKTVPEITDTMMNGKNFIASLAVRQMEFLSTQE
jgi:hypothetical protein